jgi:CO/xanthine dehydrogenase Mo-binding subunit
MVGSSDRAIRARSLSLSNFGYRSIDPSVDPLGVKGIAELGIVGVASAIANAIFHATGKRIRELPITLDKLRLGTFPVQSRRCSA